MTATAHAAATSTHRGDRSAGVPEPGGPGERLPLPRRPRRPLSVLAGSLLLVVCAVVGGALAANGQPNTTVLTLGRPVPAGQPLTAADLVPSRLTGDRVHAFAASDAPRLVGRTLLVSLPAGTLLSNAVLASPSTPTAGMLLLAAALKPGAFPPGLQQGAWVAVLQVPGNAGAAGSTALLLVARARVSEVRVEPATGVTVVSLLINADRALAVAQAAAVNAVTLAQLPSTP